MIEGSHAAFLLNGARIPQGRTMNVVAASKRQRNEWHRTFKKAGVNTWLVYMHCQGDGPAVNPNMQISYVRNRIVPCLEWMRDHSYRVFLFWHADDNRRRYQPARHQAHIYDSMPLVDHLVHGHVPGLECDEYMLARGKTWDQRLTHVRAVIQTLRETSRSPIIMHTRKQFWTTPARMRAFALGCDYYAVQYGWYWTLGQYTRFTRKCIRILEPVGCKVGGGEYNKDGVTKRARAVGDAIRRGGGVFFWNGVNPA